MDQAIKDALLERLRGYLDGLDADAGGEPPVEATSEAADLFSVFVEIAAARNEMRTQSRLVKDAIDQFHGVFETLQSSHAVLERELKEARASGREQARAAVRSLLLDIIDVRDRLAAGLAAVAPRGVSRGWRRWFGKAPAADPWREGMDMTLRRLDQVLADLLQFPPARFGVVDLYHHSGDVRIRFRRVQRVQHLMKYHNVAAEQRAEKAGGFLFLDWSGEIDHQHRPGGHPAGACKIERHSQNHDNYCPDPELTSATHSEFLPELHHLGHLHRPA